MIQYCVKLLISSPLATLPQYNTRRCTNGLWQAQYSPINVVHHLWPLGKVSRVQCWLHIPTKPTCLGWREPGSGRETKEPLHPTIHPCPPTHNNASRCASLWSTASHVLPHPGGHYKNRQRYTVVEAVYRPSLNGIYLVCVLNIDLVRCKLINSNCFKLEAPPTFPRPFHVGP